MARCVIGTAGHTDHGKSALVAALTGVHPDRLPEEKRRGITTDLGFGHARLEAAVPGGAPVEAAFIDVPGHEQFVRTMLAGAGGIDVMLLVVAAERGVQPQTREHFEICRLLAVGGGVVALAKCDVAEPAQRAAARAQIEALLADGPFAAAPILEVSSKTGAGLPALRAALWSAASASRAGRGGLPWRLPVDRAFTKDGFGTIATGTLLEGTLRLGAEAALPRSHRRLRVRGLQVHGVSVEQAVAGQRVAVNLAGTDSRLDPRHLARGTMLSEPGVFAPVSRCDAWIETLPSAPALRHRAKVRFFLHAAECNATVVWLGPSSPEGARKRPAQLRLDQPVVAVPGDRFILRQLSPALTLGGGLVLDIAPPPHAPRNYAAAAEDLSELPAASAGAGIRWHLRRAGAGGLSLDDLARALGRRQSDLALDGASGEIVGSLHPPAAVLSTHIEALENDLLAALAGFHAAHPLLPGATVDQLGAGLGPARRAPHWIALALDRLAASGRVRLAAALYRMPDFQVALSSGEAGLRQQIEDHFRAAGLALGPVPGPLASRPGARALVQMLIRERVLVECQPGVLLHREPMEALIASLRRDHATGFSVAEFKQWTGLSRKFAIPLLEHLDRMRVTRRQGERRQVAGGAA